MLAAPWDLLSCYSGRLRALCAALKALSACEWGVRVSLTWVIISHANGFRPTRFFPASLGNEELTGRPCADLPSGVSSDVPDSTCSCHQHPICVFSSELGAAVPQNRDQRRVTLASLRGRLFAILCMNECFPVLMTSLVSCRAERDASAWSYHLTCTSPMSRPGKREASSPPWASRCSEAGWAGGGPPGS